MEHTQAGILADVPPMARYLTFTRVPGADPGDVLRSLAEAVDGLDTVLGLGPSLVTAMGHEVAGLRSFPSHAGQGIEVPATPCALWLWLRGGDRGELVHRARLLQQIATPSFQVESVTDAFRFGAGLDLTGYEDGTENPKGNDAVEAAIVRGCGNGLDGSSFAAVQRWVHDLGRFESMSQTDQDHTMGRRKSDNEEIEEAPESAHVKRTAQESFDPEAFVLRRSMPWANETSEGLVFVAFGRSLDAFEALLNRMIGSEDGITDALLTFTRPVTGSYFWCPPVKDGQLDLSAVGL